MFVTSIGIFGPVIKRSMMRKLALIVVFGFVGCAEWGALTKGEIVPNETMERVMAAKAHAALTERQKADFGVLATLAGRTFRGEPAEENASGEPIIQLWLWGQEGKTLIIKNRFEDGSYGGDMVIRKDPLSGRLTYTYKTNTGLGMAGIVTLTDDGGWQTADNVPPGWADLIQVRSHGWIRADGALIITSDTSQDQDAGQGGSYIYHEVWRDLPALQTPIPD